MARDWIKMRSDLYRDPKVIRISDSLLDADGDLARYVNQNEQCDMAVTRNVTRNAAVGALVAVWGVARHEGERINDHLLIRGATLATLDDIADLPGFGSAMASVGWAVESEEGVTFPRFFLTHNEDPREHERNKNAERQARHRAKKQAQDQQESNVTNNVTRNVTVTDREREEGEKSNESVPNGTDSTPKPPKGDSGGSVKLPESLRTDDFKRAWADWVRHRKEIKKPLKPTQAQKQIAKFAEWGPARSIAAITHTITKGWTGLREPEDDDHARRAGHSGPCHPAGRGSLLDREIDREQQQLAIILGSGREDAAVQPG